MILTPSANVRFGDKTTVILSSIPDMELKRLLEEEVISKLARIFKTDSDEEPSEVTEYINNFGTLLQEKIKEYLSNSFPNVKFLN